MKGAVRSKAEKRKGFCFLSARGEGQWKGKRALGNGLVEMCLFFKPFLWKKDGPCLDAILGRDFLNTLQGGVSSGEAWI